MPLLASCPLTHTPHARNAIGTTPLRPGTGRWVRRIAQLGITAPCIWWSGFALLVLRDEGMAALPYAATLVLVLLITSMLAWFRPRIGGALAMLGAFACAGFFPHWAPLTLLALPLLLSGAVLLAARDRA